MKRYALLLVLAVACTSARHIREAQDSFSRAATAENAASTEQLVPGSIRADYRLALQAVDQELAANTEKLRGERLLGAALTLKAMCQWRLAYLEGTDGGDMKLTLADITAEGKNVVIGERDALPVCPLAAPAENLDRSHRSLADSVGPRLQASRLDPQLWGGARRVGQMTDGACGPDAIHCGGCGQTCWQRRPDGAPPRTRPPTSRYRIR